MANYFDQFDPAQGSNFFDKFDEKQPKPAPVPERGWGEAIVDTALGIAKGGVGVAKLLPMAVGAADTVISKAFGLEAPASGGALDNAAVRGLNQAEEYLQAKKSAELRAKEAASQTQAEEFGQKYADDFVVRGVPVGQIAAEFASKFGSALSDPTLLLQGVSENVASVVPSGLIGRTVQKSAEVLVPKVAKTLTTEAVETTARRLGTAGAITTGAVQQGADVASEAYDKAMKLSDEVWGNNTRFSELSNEIGADKAKKQIAGELATDAGIKAGLESLLVNAAGAKFGGATLEQAFLKKTPSTATGAGAAGAAKGFVKGGLGEALTEAPEEGYGAYATNQALAQIDPTTNLYKGVGAAAGQGAATAFGMGSVTGARQGLANGLISRQRAEAEQALNQARTVDDMVGAADALAGSVADLTSATDAYLGQMPPAAPIVPGAPAAPIVPGAPAAPDLQQLQSRIDREAELLRQANGEPIGSQPEQLRLQAARLEAQAATFNPDEAGPAGQPSRAQSLLDQAQNLRKQADQIESRSRQPGAGFEADRQNALAQIEATRTEPKPRVAADFVDLTPMNPRQAQSRLAVLRDQVANQGGNALELAIVSHPSQQGALAIGRTKLPSLDLETTPPTITPAEAQQRIETAALTGTVNARTAEDRNSRQVVIDRALRNVEQRGGVASPAEARIFQEAGLGKPYDRIDTSLAPALSTNEQLTQATGIILGNPPRSQETQRSTTTEERPARLANEGLVGTRVQERLSQPSDGKVVTSNATLSTQRQLIPGSVNTLTDEGQQHSFTVADVSALGLPGKVLQQIARIFGKRLVVFNSDTLKADGFVMNDDNRNIFVNAKSQVSPLAVFGHELLHILKRENPKAYQALEAVIRREMQDSQDQQNYYAGYSPESTLEEMTADLMGNRFQDPQFWLDVFNEIAAQNPESAAGIIQRLATALNRAIADLMRAFKQAGYEVDAFVKDADAVRAALKDALVDYAKQQRQPASEMAATAETATAGTNATLSLQPDERANTERQQEGRVGQVDTHVLNVARGERATADRTTVNAEEKAIIREAAKKMNLPVSEVEQMVRDHKAAHPADAGWAQLTLTGVKIDEDTGKGDLQYQVIPYSFNAGANGKALESNTPEYEGKVANLAQAMLREVLGVFARAQTGDVAAKNIIAQSGWYKEMRTRLRQEFGGLGDLFADLLGATSPNTPVRTNWDNSVEALRLATTGAFDKLMPQWVAYFDNLDQAETQFRAVFDRMLKAGMTKAEIKRSPEFQEQQQQVRAARSFPDELLPLKSNGKKFGFNGFNVARAMVDLWRVVKNADPDIGRGGTAPKAINFSGNLIGFRSRATIDVWAARMLQRLAGGLRIPSMAESGVTGEALESGRNTLQFGLGQDVFSRAVNLIRNDPVLSQDPVLSRINDDDLQALVWFIEKEVWTKGNWTSAAGEGGSFEFEADLAGVSDRERVNELRKVADSSVASTKEQRDQAEADIQRLTQEMAALPEIAKANAKLEANAQQMAADKTAPKAEKLTKLQKEGIQLENAAARAAKKKAKTGKAYKALEAQLNKAKAVLKKPTTEERRNLRTGALQELGKIARTVDRFTVGLSIQKGAEQGVEPTPPTDSAMADLAQKIADAVVAGDPGATVIGLKAIATEGRYGAPERALDLEAITRAGFDPRPLAVAAFDAADQASQDAAFVARVLRPNELFDPQMHRPGVEIYFRDMNQAAEAARMMAGIAGIRVGKTTEFGPGYFEIGGYTVIVDGRPTAEAKAGAMGKPVGMRVLYMPEFEARYGIDPRLENATDEQLAGIIEDRADTLGDFADAVLRQFDGVSFAGRFNYEVDTRFAGEYQGAIDAYTNRTTDERAGQGGETPWAGRSIRESIAAATGQLPVNANQPGTELPGGNRSETKLSQPRTGKPTTQASKPRPESLAVFKALDGRGLAKARAEAALRARPDAGQVRYIQNNFLDILAELEDSGRIKINCD
jgi:hypothetical protein